MSYDCSLLDPDTKEVLEVSFITGVNGGTQVMGGTNRLWLNVTYNYTDSLRKAFEVETGLWSLKDVTAKASRQVLMDAIGRLSGEPDDDYWKDTEGNARHALIGLLTLSMHAPDEAIWEIS